jgi:hypothetical protein
MYRDDPSFPFTLQEQQQLLFAREFESARGRPIRAREEVLVGGPVPSPEASPAFAHDVVGNSAVSGASIEDAHSAAVSSPPGASSVSAVRCNDCALPYSSTLHAGSESKQESSESKHSEGILSAASTKSGTSQIPRPETLLGDLPPVAALARYDIVPVNYPSKSRTCFAFVFARLVFLYWPTLTAATTLSHPPPPPHTRARARSCSHRHLQVS